MSTAVQNPFRINISQDQLRAHLVVTDPDPAAVTTDNILKELGQSAIPITDEIMERVNAVVESVQAGELPSEPFLLVEGREAVPGRPASFQLAADDRDPQEDEEEEGRVDFRRSHILTVNTGDEIGTLTPEIPPVPGVDVLGASIPGEKPFKTVRLSDNVELGKDGETVVATTSGRVQLTRDLVSVVEVVEIKGDVDYSSGNVESPTDVLITGTVRETFEVRSAKSVAVQGAIEAAAVEAGTHVHVRGGITARRGGRVLAGGEICAKFCEDADLQAGGDIVITREAMNSRIYAAGRLVVPRGAVIGGYAYAREGAEIRELGNVANIRTRIAIGVDPTVLAEARQTDEIIRRKREAAAKIREKVQPLMAQLKRLTPQQRERVTELMHEADEMEAGILEQEKSRGAVIASKNPTGDSQPALLITGKLYPGVVVIIGDKMVNIEKERRGPVKIVRRPVKRVEEIMMVDQVSGSTQILPSYDYAPDLTLEEPKG